MVNDTHTRRRSLVSTKQRLHPQSVATRWPSATVAFKHLLLLLAGLKGVSLTDVVLPTTGPTPGLIDDDADDKPSDEAAEAEMSEADITDDESDEEEMEADNADGAQVWLS